MLARGRLLVRTEALAILIAQLATGPQDWVDVGAMEEWAIKVLPVAARTRQVVLLTTRVDGQDEVDDLVEDVTRQSQETRAGVLKPRRIVALGEEDLDVCKSTKSVHRCACTLKSTTTLLQTCLSTTDFLHELGLELQIFNYHGGTGPLLGFGGFLRLWLCDSATDGGMFLGRIGLGGSARRPGGHHGCLLVSDCLLQSQKVTSTLDVSMSALGNGEQRKITRVLSWFGKVG